LISSQKNSTPRGFRKYYRTQVLHTLSIVFINLFVFRSFFQLKEESLQLLVLGTVKLERSQGNQGIIVSVVSKYDISCRRTTRLYSFKSPNDGAVVISLMKKKESDQMNVPWDEEVQVLQLQGSTINGTHWLFHSGQNDLH